MAFEAFTASIGAAPTAVATVGSGETWLATNCLLVNVHPTADVLVDVWLEMGANRVYLEAGTMLKGDVTRRSYSLPVKGMTLGSGTVLRVLAYQGAATDWFGGGPFDVWADLDWFGLSVDPATLVDATLSVFRL